MATTVPFVTPTVPECVWPTVTDEALQCSPLSDFPCAKWTSELVFQAGRCVGVDITSLRQEAMNIRELTGNVCYNLHCHINDLRTESTAMRNELDGHKQDTDAVKESTTRIQTQIDKLMSKLPLTPSCLDKESRQEPVISELLTIVTALRVDVDGFLKYERYNTLNSTIEAQYTRLQSENALRDAQICEVDQREEVKRLKQDNSRLEARLCALEEKEETTKAAVAICDQLMKAFVDRTQTFHAELQKTVSALQEDITKLKNANPSAAVTQLEKDVEECNDQIANLQIRCHEAEKKASHDCDMAVQFRPSVVQILHETKEQRAVCTALRSDHDALQTSVRDSVDMLLSKIKEAPSRTEIDATKDVVALLESKLSARSPVDILSLIHQDIDRVKHILQTPTAKFADNERSIVYALLELFSLLDQTCAICRGFKDTRDCTT
jgi:chromosome segregation ATPase